MSDSEEEITEESIQSILKYCNSGSRNSIKRLLKLYHIAIKSRSPKSKDKIYIDESLYEDLINKSHEYAIKLFDQNGPLTQEGEDVKIRITAKTFVLDTLLLLSNNKSPLDSIRLSLVTLSKPNIIRWIIGISHVEIQFLKLILKFLCNYPNHKIRLSSFSLLKSYFETILIPEYNLTQYGHLLRNGLNKYESSELLSKRINTFSLGLYKSYLNSLSKGLNPRNWTLSRLSRNCIVELLLLVKSDVLYTIAFKQIKKIGRDVVEAWKKSKLDSICNWSFVESLTIWATIIGRITPALDPLVYPLVTICTASLKLGQTNERFAPFVLYISKELNQLSLVIDKFIPIASHLLTLLDKLIKHSKIHKSDKLPRPELAIFKLSLSQKREDEIIHHVEDLSRIIITQHISLLAHHPSFPEIILPIVKHLKKYKIEKPWIKHLLVLINESSDIIKNLRKDIKLEKGNLDKLVFFKTCKIPIIIHSIKELELMESGIAKALNCDN